MHSHSFKHRPFCVRSFVLKRFNPLCFVTMRIHRYEPLSGSRDQRRLIDMFNATVIYVFVFSICALTTVLMC